MTRNALFALLFSVSMLVVGCGGGSDLRGDLNDIYSELEAQGSILCDCYIEAGHPSRAMCEIDWFVRPTPEQVDCVVAALELDEVSSLDANGCVLDAERDFTDCVNANLVCTENTSVNVCYEAYAGAVGLCPPRAMVVGDALALCFAN